MAPSKKYWSLQSFVAHSSNVNCLAIGQKYGNLMVTGGQDHKINMWTIGEPKCVMSLNGHTSPINCVQFGIEEDLMISGSISGNIKIWNLSESKAKRKLIGHKASVNCLHVHPYGQYIASGSMDTNVALWDVRKSICAFSYKGHKGSVNSVKFSPDGNWIASASDDGYVKVWDLKAGKLLKDIKISNGSALRVEFNPIEFLMATTSTDRTIQFWDLETFNLISSTDCDVNPTTATLFNSEGNCLYAGSKDYCRVVGWEPAFIHDSVKVGWGRIADMAMRSSHLIGASFQQNVVSTFAVDIQKLGPFQMDLSDISNRTLTPANSPFPSKINSSGRQRKSFDKTPSAKRLSLSLAKEQRSNSSPESDPSEESDFEAFHKGKDIFIANNHLSRSPQQVRDVTNNIDLLKLDGIQEVHNDYKYKPPLKSARAGPTISPQTPRPVSTPAATKTTAPSVSDRPTSRPGSRPASRPNSRPTSRHKQDDKTYESTLTSDDLSTAAVAPACELPLRPNNTEHLLDSMLKGHKAVNAILISRYDKFMSFKKDMDDKNINTALMKAIDTNDLSVMMDLVNVLLDAPEMWSLDIFHTLCNQFTAFTSSKYEHYVLVGIRCTRLLLQNYGEMIKSCVSPQQSSMVDVAREERNDKCRYIYKHMMGARTTLGINLNSECYKSLSEPIKQLDMLMIQFE